MVQHSSPFHDKKKTRFILQLAIIDASSANVLIFVTIGSLKDQVDAFIYGLEQTGFKILMETNI